MKQGDVVGIIGKNGAGKSTLLKLLSRVTSPTTGAIRAKGRIASLLEVGTGFHPELTGRENIYMNGSIMGMTRHEINRKLDEIVDFAGVERYIDTPVKRYSSGMTVRLGFAVAAFLEPEILVVDEVLAVGDAEFQKKAIGKMQDVSKGEGRTVLFVSHNMAAVKSLCKNGIVLSNGQIVFQGTADESVNFYIGNQIKDIISHSIITNKYRDDFGLLKHELEYKEVWLLNRNAEAMSSDEPIIIKSKIKRNDPQINAAKFNTIIINQSDQRILFCRSELIEIPNNIDEFYIYTTINKHGLPQGKYFIRLEANLHSFTNRTKSFDWVNNVLSFEIKYIHQAIKDEYLNWNPFNGIIIHNEELITNELLFK